MDQIEGPWSLEEDEMLLNLFLKHGSNWSVIGKSMPAGISSETCRSRWISLLDKDMNQIEGRWSSEEDEMLLNLFEKHGSNWSRISWSIPGKSHAKCWSRWFSLAKKDIDKKERLWSRKEDSMLRYRVKRGYHWSLISDYIPGRSAKTCRSRWLSLVKEEMDEINKLWIPEEDEMLEYLVEKYRRDWSLISKSIQGRSARTCKLRWLSLQRSFTPEEDEMLLNLFEKHGPNWSLISKSIPDRSGKSCSSRWLSLQRSFTPEDYRMLQNIIKIYGRNWSLLSKSCRARWLSSPQVRPFTPEEDHAILLAHARYGERWNGIAELLGRPYDVIENHWISTLRWKSSSTTNAQEITKGDHDIYIPPPSFSDVVGGQGSSYSHDGNLSHEVGGVSKSAPSISYMARINMSSGGTHSYSRDKSGPSIGYMARENMSSGGIHCFSRDKTAPSWNALNKWRLSPRMIQSDNVQAIPSAEFEPKMIKNDNVQEIPSDEFSWNTLFGEDGDK